MFSDFLVLFSLLTFKLLIVHIFCFKNLVMKKNMCARVGNVKLGNGSIQLLTQGTPFHQNSLRKIQKQSDPAQVLTLPLDLLASETRKTGNLEALKRSQPHIQTYSKPASGRKHLQHIWCNNSLHNPLVVIC